MIYPFSEANNIYTNAMILSQDLNVIMNWSFPCKMFFNPDLRKQAQEVIFSRKIKKLFYPTILLKNI